MADTYRIVLSLCLAGMSRADRRCLGASLGISIKSTITKGETIIVLKHLLGDTFPWDRVEYLSGRGYPRACAFVAEVLKKYTMVNVTPGACGNMFRRVSNQGRELTDEGRAFLKMKSWPPMRAS